MADTGDLVFEHREDWCKKALLRKSATMKGRAKLLRPNVHHFLRLVHMTNVASLPPLWTALARALKAHHLEMLQDVLDGNAASLAAWVLLLQPRFC